MQLRPWLELVNWSGVMAGHLLLTKIVSKVVTVVRNRPHLEKREICNDSLKSWGVWGQGSPSWILTGKICVRLLHQTLKVGFSGRATSRRLNLLPQGILMMSPFSFSSAEEKAIHVLFWAELSSDQKCLGGWPRPRLIFVVTTPTSRNQKCRIPSHVHRTIVFVKFGADFTKVLLWCTAFNAYTQPDQYL